MRAELHTKVRGDRFAVHDCSGEGADAALPVVRELP